MLAWSDSGLWDSILAMSALRTMRSSLLAAASVSGSLSQIESASSVVTKLRSAFGKQLSQSSRLTNSVGILGLLLPAAVVVLAIVVIAALAA